MSYAWNSYRYCIAVQWAIWFRDASPLEKTGRTKREEHTKKGSYKGIVPYLCFCTFVLMFCVQPRLNGQWRYYHCGSKIPSSTVQPWLNAKGRPTWIPASWYSRQGHSTIMGNWTGYSLHCPARCCVRCPGFKHKGTKKQRKNILCVFLSLCLILLIGHYRKE